MEYVYIVKAYSPQPFYSAAFEREVQDKVRDVLAVIVIDGFGLDASVNPGERNHVTLWTERKD